MPQAIGLAIGELLFNLGAPLALVNFFAIGAGGIPQRVIEPGVCRRGALHPVPDPVMQDVVEHLGGEVGSRLWW